MRTLPPRVEVLPGSAARKQDTTALCEVCRAPSGHCFCDVPADRLRYLAAQVSLVHHPTPDARCHGCGYSVALCGYLALIRQARTGTAPAEPAVPDDLQEWVVTCAEHYGLPAGEIAFLLRQNGLPDADVRTVGAVLAAYGLDSP
ncbi:MAG TPA: hypothetical protein VLJ59_03370 [Mycobacteriales bacterium]|nr:hypothetical protein [Mycobacteriales bacterium]